MNELEIRQLTVLQPFASWILSGEKTVELRPWKTDFRGWLFIGSGKRVLTHEMPHGPTATALGMVELIDIAPADRVRNSAAACIDVWQYSAKFCKDRTPFAWKLGHRIRFGGELRPFTGSQGLRKLDGELLDYARAQYELASRTPCPNHRACVGFPWEACPVCENST